MAKKRKKIRWDLLFLCDKLTISENEKDKKHKWKKTNKNMN